MFISSILQDNLAKTCLHEKSLKEHAAPH